MTIFKEISRNHYHGYWEIVWRCIACKHNVCLPQQQNFSYCMHCGNKVIRKIGGHISIEEEIELANDVWSRRKSNV